MGTPDKIQGRKNKETAINHSRTQTQKVKAQPQYTGVNKQVKDSTKSDKQK